MKRVETIIKQIDKLERELYTNYDDKTIKEAIEKCERNKTIHTNNCDLISVIYEGVTNNIILDDFINNKEE